MRRVDAGRVGRLALATGLGGFVLAVVSGLLLFMGASAGVALGARGALVTALLVLAVRVLLARCPQQDRLGSAAAGLAGGYLLNLGWLGGATYVARAVTGSVPLAAALDLLLWMVVGLAALRLVPPGDGPHQRPTGYV